MAELLVRTLDNIHPDPTIDRMGCFKKGDIVHVGEDGHGWGSKESLPDFVLVKVPGVSLAAAIAYRDAWKSDLQFAVVFSDQATDSYQISISNTNAGAGAIAGVTRSQVEEYLSSWGLSVVSINANEVVFNASIYDVAVSQGFWNLPVDRLVFNELAYDQSTGLHTISTDYSSVPPKYWHIPALRVSAFGGTVVSDSNQVLTWSVGRSVVRQVFQQDVKEKAEYIWKTRRWSFSPSDVDAAVAAGGVVTQTPAQVTAKLRDATA